MGGITARSSGPARSPRGSHASRSRTSRGAPGSSREGIHPGGCEVPVSGNVTLTGGVGHCAGSRSWDLQEQKESPVSIFSRHKSTLVEPEQALPGRSERMFPIAAQHKVLDAPVVTDEVPEGYEVAIFGLGCFWGAEEIYWKTPGVWSTSVGLRRRHHAQPVVRGGLQRPHQPHRGRADRLRPQGRLVRRPGQEVLRGARPDPGLPPGQRRRHPVPLGDLLDHARAGAGRARADRGLRRGADRRRLGEITTEIRPASETPYYYAEDAHQQYLAKNPFGYRCHANTGVKFPA